MTARSRQPAPEAPRDAPAAHAEWLAALADVHDLVLAFDRDGRMLCAHGGLGEAAGGGAPAPRTVEEWLAAQTDAEARHALAPWLARQAPASSRDRLRFGDADHDVRRFDVGEADGNPRTILLVDRAGPDATNDLRRKNAELETSLRGAAHDLRSPLVSVLGFAKLLRDEFGDPIGRTGRHFVDRIEQAGKNMERLLHDLLELSRIEESPTTPVHVNAIVVLEQIAAELKMKLDEAGVRLSFPEEAPIVVCDRTRLYQLLSNLVGNALRHAARDDGGRIDVGIATVEGGWEIRVQDDGPGIAAEDQERIFQAFQRAEATPPRGAKKSTGLGLAIVRRIVEAHAGHVHVESELGQGACFVVFLPRPETQSSD